MTRWTEAEALLKQVDEKMAGVVVRAGPCTLTPGEGGFVTLADSIIGQQLSNRVAIVLRERFRGLFHGKMPTALKVLELSDESLFGAGFSRAKVRYVKALAESVASGELDFNRLQEQNDEDLIASLSKIPGIGRWTAEMYLIFALNRPDVLPLGDAAIASAFRKLYMLPESEWRQAAERIAGRWRPWRTVGCWYLWWYHRDRTKKSNKPKGREPF